MTENRGQFGYRSDTQAAARAGGVASSAKQDMSELGRRGAAAQSREGKAKGGRHSHRGS
jgi:uncharacterized protein